MVGRFFAFLAVLACVVVAIAACKRPSSNESSPPPPVVTDTSADLLFIWIDEKGESHVEQSVANVPPAARDAVRVVDPNREPAAEHVWVADLRNAGAGGGYQVRTMPRPEWDGIAAARREKHGSVLAARPPGSAREAPRPAVIIYGASWCGPCHQAAAYLTRRGVAFVEKDIEQDGSAAREMQAKLAKAGMRGGSIPVLDVRGRILVGFDEGAVARALAD